MMKAIFLDKDGTLVDNSGYPTIIPTDKLLYQDILAGLSWLQQEGYALIVISNQSWIAEGRLSHAEVQVIFSSIRQQLQSAGISITDVFYCPHARADNCLCHKPQPGLIVRAAEKHGIDLSQSYMVGDRENDILAGKRAGVKTILVQTGCGKNYTSPIIPDFIVPSLNHIQEAIQEANDDDHSGGD